MDDNIQVYIEFSEERKRKIEDNGEKWEERESNMKKRVCKKNQKVKGESIIEKIDGNKS